MSLTTVHLLRHGEVHNPEGVLYGRLPGYHLSERGQAMAQRIAEFLSDDADGPARDIAAVIASPLQRAQETAAPIAAALGLEVGTDERVIEADNQFEGLTFGIGDGSLKHPRHWWKVRNPFKPSWGEPYHEQADRVLAAVHDAAAANPGRETVIVSHQLPIWITRLLLEGKRLWHDPRKRECSLASLTSITLRDGVIVGLDYSEPAADLLPSAPSVSGA